jgi:hypothetical protein
LVLFGFGSSIFGLGFGAGLRFFLTPFHSRMRHSWFAQQAGSRPEMLTHS